MRGPAALPQSAPFTGTCKFSMLCHFEEIACSRSPRLMSIDDVHLVCASQVLGGRVIYLLQGDVANGTHLAHEQHDAPMLLRMVGLPPSRCKLASSHLIAAMHLSSVCASRQGDTPVRLLEVPLSAASLSSEDCCVLTTADRVFAWTGSRTSDAKRADVGSIAESLCTDRHGKAAVGVSGCCSSVQGAAHCLRQSFRSHLERLWY